MCRKEEGGAYKITRIYKSIYKINREYKEKEREGGRRLSMREVDERESGRFSAGDLCMRRFECCIVAGMVVGVYTSCFNWLR